MTVWRTSAVDPSLVISLALVLAVLIAFWPTTGNKFVDWDDGPYVTRNPHVRGGLTLNGVVWAFTSLGYAENWHPLTWLSHMLDVELFGLNPRGHHLVSVILHAGNAILLFLVLRAMTGTLWRSALVAVLFAVHPLHVESVAWVAERKDVLSTLFWLLATAAYLQYVWQRSLGRYCAVLGLFALGFLAKPMLMTLPFVFLLLDYWPLGRMQPVPRASQTGKKAKITAAPSQDTGRAEVLSLVLEKVPFFALSALSAVMTWVAQSRGGAMGYTFPFWYRLSNAMLAYATYLWKTVWPINLAAVYSHPRGALPTWRVLAAVLFLTTVSALVLWERRRRPYLVTGWCWYLGTLVPVIGLVQVGVQSMADRYTYIPLIGIFMMAAWCLPASVLTDPRQSKAAVGAGAVLLAGLMTLTWVQTTHWQDSQALFEHAVAVTKNNYLAHNNLGTIYAKLGRVNEASLHLKEALRLWPDSAEANYNLGTLLFMSGKLDEAREYFLKAIRAKPDYVDAYDIMGIAFFRQGKLGEALEYFQEAVRRKPDFADAHYNAAAVLLRMGRLKEAVLEYRTGLRLNPNHEAAQSAQRDVMEILKGNPDIQ